MTDYDRLKHVCKVCGQRHKTVIPRWGDGCIVACVGCPYTTEITFIVGNSNQLETVIVRLGSRTYNTIVRPKAKKPDDTCKHCWAYDWCFNGKETHD